MKLKGQKENNQNNRFFIRNIDREKLKKGLKKMYNPLMITLQNNIFEINHLL